MKKVECMVIGANGLVGRRIGKLLSEMKISWAGTFCKRAGKGLVQLDITDTARAHELITGLSPRAVFHCANLAGGVDFCESNPGIAEDFHLNATKNIARECAGTGAMPVFFSTDYVFDGLNTPYKEYDPPNPLNLYGRLKLSAENWIRDNLKNHLIIRTTNVYGWDPETTTPNYIMSMYRALKDGKFFNAPSFLQGNPTYVGDLAQAALELYNRKAAGIFHVVGGSLVNRYEWAKDACEVLGLDHSLLREIREAVPGMVKRPLKSWLNTDKFAKSYRTVLHDLPSGLKLMRQDMESPVFEKST
jgi:dTDP-4-dehydrorhamnose reductase